MKAFHHVNARTVDEAVGLLKSGDGESKVIAGGTDLLGILKDKILPYYPGTIINLKCIENLDYVEEDTGGLKIGSLTRLDDIVRSPVVRERYSILADAAKAVATPQIRNLGTIGGNLCQDVRCLYYRYPHQIGERILCKRKGGKSCLAVAGDNRLSSIMGSKGCFAVCPSDMAIALTALNADIRITGTDGSKMVPVRDFYTTSGNVLGKAEIITEVLVPPSPEDERAVFLKFRLRDAIDFAIVSVASAFYMEDGLCNEARIVLGAVAPVPVRASASEEFLKGRQLTEEAAEKAAGMALEKARPLSMNAYKIPIARMLVKQSIMAAVS